MIPSAANGEYCTTNESGADIAIFIAHGFANGVDLVMAWNAIILSGVLGFFYVNALCLNPHSNTKTGKLIVALITNRNFTTWTTADSIQTIFEIYKTASKLV